MEKESPDQYISRIIEDLKYKNKVYDDFNTRLDRVYDLYIKTIKRGDTILYRARIYLEADKVEKK